MVGRCCFPLTLVAFCVAALLGTSAYAQPLRVEQSLNADQDSGIWTLTPIDPDTSVYPAGPIGVPRWWSDHNPDWDDDWNSPMEGDNKTIHQAEYTRSFTADPAMAGKRVKLHFGEVNHSCEVRVDDQLVGPKHYQGTVPLEYDMTDYVTPGAEQQLSVMVWDHLDLTDNPSNPDVYRYPFGHPMWAHKMNGIAQSVTLHAVPEVYVKDVFVKTSVDNQEITLEITIANEGASSASVDVENDICKITEVQPEVLEGTPSLQVNSTGATVVADGTEEVVTLIASWSNAELWWPHDPQLYRLHTRLVESGVTIDEKKDVRFGFREFRIDPAIGTRYELNGVPFHGWGDTQNMINRNFWDGDGDRELIEYMIDVYLASGCRLMRHGAAAPPPPMFYDVCDEKGMLCYAEMDFNGQNEDIDIDGFYSISHDYLHADFKTHVTEMIQALVKRDRNHPSIVIWSIENEVFYNTPPSDVLPSSEHNNYAAWIASQQDVINALDGTRPVGCDHEGTLNGALAIKNKHYPATVYNLNDNFRSKATVDATRNDNIYYPDEDGGVNINEPFGLGEWMFNRSPTSNEGQINCPSNWGRLKALQLRSYRLFGFSDIRPFTLTQEALTRSWSGKSTRNSHMLMRHSMSPVAVFDHDYDGMGVYEIKGWDVPSYDEGTVVTRGYDIYNDDLDDLSTDVTVPWEVKLYGQVTDSGSETVSVGLAEVLREHDISWTVPQVNADDTPFIVGLTAWKSGEQVFRTYYVFKVNDTGGEAVTGVGTFKDDFSDAALVGFKEHDVWWNVENGEYVQPEIRGLFPYNGYWQNTSTNERDLPSSPFGANPKIAAVDGYQFDNFRASFDVRILGMDGTNQLAGMMFRTAHPEDGPYYESDTTRRTGYFVGIRRNQDQDYDSGTGNSNWRLVIGKADSGGYTNLVTSSALDPPGQDYVRVEVTFDGDTITAEARNVNEETTIVQAAAGPDNTYTSGHASLYMREGVAAAYDNVQIGGAPFAPVITDAIQTGPGVVDVVWSPEADVAEYYVEWSNEDGSQTGSSGWISDSSYSFDSLPDGQITFQVYSTTSDGQESGSSVPVVVTVQSGEGQPVPTVNYTGIALLAALLVLAGAAPGWRRKTRASRSDSPGK